MFNDEKEGAASRNGDVQVFMVWSRSGLRHINLLYYGTYQVGTYVTSSFVDPVFVRCTVSYIACKATVIRVHLYSSFHCIYFKCTRTSALIATSHVAFYTYHVGKFGTIRHFGQAGNPEVTKLLTLTYGTSTPTHPRTN